MYRIFIVEDERGIAEAVASALSAWGYDCRRAENMQDIMPEFESFAPQLVLLDIMLPFRDGYHWCREIRKNSAVPIIFISSAADNMNIIMAMNMGGDDFISKPFDLSVLTAKVQALLRRSYGLGETPALSHRGAALNSANCCLSYEGRRLELSKNECRILSTLMEARGAVVSREKLMQRLWETDSFVDENTLTVNVGRLRRKLEVFGLPGFILTKHGLGYYLGG